MRTFPAWLPGLWTLARLQPVGQGAAPPLVHGLLLCIAEILTPHTLEQSNSNPTIQAWAVLVCGFQLRVPQVIAATDEHPGIVYADLDFGQQVILPST